MFANAAPPGSVPILGGASPASAEGDILSRPDHERVEWPGRAGLAGRAGRDGLGFGEFVELRWTALVRFGYVLTGDWAAAEDLTQTALERTWRCWSQVRAENPERYVKAAMANQMRSRWRRRTVEVADGVPYDGASLGGHPDDHALRETLWAALLNLPDRMRAVIVLRVWEDLSEAETARLLGCSIGTVKSQSSRGMRRLRRHRAAAALTAGIVVVTGFGVVLSGASGRPNGHGPVSQTPAGTGLVLGAELGSGWQRALQRRAVSEGKIAVGDEGPLAPPDARSIDVRSPVTLGPIDWHSYAAPGPGMMPGATRPQPCFSVGSSARPGRRRINCRTVR